MRNPLVRGLERLGRDTSGNVAIVFALTLFPVIAVSGMSVDYTLAGRRQSQIGAIADAAALMTTSPPGMALSASAAQQAATAMFNAQAATVFGVSVQAINITVQDTSTANGVVTRNTTVPYTATSQNAFSGLLRMATMTIGGTSKVSSSAAPNVDFYLLLDTSPSMGIPSTPAGIQTLQDHTTAQQPGGCAFACHESNPSPKDIVGNPGGIDNYAYARSLNLPLRIDLVSEATANLMQTAAQFESTNNAVYRVATYTFDSTFKTITSLTSNLTQAQSDANSKIQMLEVYKKNYVTQSTEDQSEDTQFDPAMANSVNIPNPGNGTKSAGDTPQEVLFIVTDGIVDENYPSYGPTDNVYPTNRAITTVGHQKDYCTSLKNRGVRIAIIYTTYTPITTDSFYNNYVNPIQPRDATDLQTCASPGLFFQVDSGGDINGAMQALFVKALGSAHLTQ